MNNFPQIKSPTLLLDRQKCQRNIQRMVAKAKDHGLLFRPHFKTHQSAAIGEWFKEHGVKNITVSSVSMAWYFADHGWDDITIAFPVNLREMDEINSLAKRINLNLLLDSQEGALRLQIELKAETGVFIEIDTGSKRSGIEANELQEIERIIGILSKSSSTRFMGFLTHAGHTYRAKDKAEVREFHQESLRQMKNLKEHFAACKPIISIGDTPSCSLAEDFSGADEIRPGNFVFYDLMQAGIGSCTPEDIALATVCPIVAKHPHRSELVIYGGAIHLSKDFLRLSNGSITFGRVAKLNKTNWEILPEGNEVVSVSQEHGIVKLQSRFLDEFSIGELITIIPVHSCLTAHQLKRYQTFEGDVL
ncbi:MAG: alanine racemase [Bacteroidales bacterium]|nr:alanine racemase [Bacteroidales bacterium]